MRNATHVGPRSAGAAILLFAALSRTAFAQPAVPVHQEPRHHLVAENPRLYILDVQIEPGDTTLFHTHATPIHYVTIGSSATNAQTMGREWPPARSGGSGRGMGGASWVLSYATQPLTHRVTNIGSGLFRLIAVVHRGAPAVMPSTAPLPGRLEAESEWFRRARITLAPGTAVTLDGAAVPLVAVQVSDGSVEAVPTDDASASSNTPGGWLLLESTGGYALRNTGPAAVTLVLVQVTGG